ncbi:hypothetical protein RJ40_02135 [Methanofollis aquaemaris]|uniref:Transposase IS4-like domain-containing protein n=1 Tax=Methanofollis aquaemaris TaxID=126734 RepID=A0A8A3S2T2_9EURY|nr:hypothetical protein RJ40_02135 [Methanofollis aquaemaris]
MRRQAIRGTAPPEGNSQLISSAGGRRSARFPAPSKPGEEELRVSTEPQKPVHDIKHAEKLLNQCTRTRRTECYCMDRGYDSETLHQKIREEIGAYSLIPVRKWKGKIDSGHYRQEMFDGFDREKYH